MSTPNKNRDPVKQTDTGLDGEPGTSNQSQQLPAHLATAIDSIISAAQLKSSESEPRATNLDLPASLQRTQAAILKLACLFHRPASKSALDCLLAAPAIDGLTDAIPEHIIAQPPNFLSRLFAWQRRPSSSPSDLTTREEASALWLEAISNLQNLNLLSPDSDANPGGLSAPRIVRDYVADHLRSTDPQAWRASHYRLFKYYQGLLPAKYPNTLAEMEPLYAAIVHGCYAEAHQEAFDRVYVERMLHRQDLYLGKALGAYDAWLDALRQFFTEPWTKPAAQLNPDSQRTALAQAGFALRGTGQLREATKPIRIAIELAIEQQNWVGASAETQNLSEILSTLGELSDSLLIARDSVRFAEKTGDSLRRLSARARLGDALHQFGETRLAARNFRRAERWQHQARKDLPLLISLRHYNYSDLLLSLGRQDEVRVRGLWSLDVSREFQGRGMTPLDIALDKLTIARAAHAQWRDTKGLTNTPFYPPSKDEDGDPDAEPGQEDKTTEDTLPPSVPSVRVIKEEAITDNKLNTDHHDAATRAFNQSVDELRQERQVQYLPAALIARAAFLRENQNFDSAKADLDEAKSIAAKDEMRLYLADITLERIRLILAEHPTLETEHIKSEVNALWLNARDLIQACCYHRRDSELEDLKQTLKKIAGN